MSERAKMTVSDYLIHVVLTKEEPYWRADVDVEDVFNSGPEEMPIETVSGSARSYSKAKAIAYALEDLAAKILKEEGR